MHTSQSACFCWYIAPMFSVVRVMLSAGHSASLPRATTGARLPAAPSGAWDAANYKHVRNDTHSEGWPIRLTGPGFLANARAEKSGAHISLVSASPGHRRAPIWAAWRAQFSVPRCLVPLPFEFSLLVSRARACGCVPPRHWRTGRGGAHIACARKLLHDPATSQCSGGTERLGITLWIAHGAGEAVRTLIGQVLHIPRRLARGTRGRHRHAELQRCVAPRERLATARHSQVASLPSWRSCWTWPL